MKRLFFSLLAAGVLALALPACTDRYSTGFLPQTHASRPMDTGGGNPGKSQTGSGATPTPSPTP